MDNPQIRESPDLNIITRLADAYHISEEALCHHTNANTRRVFGTLV